MMGGRMQAGTLLDRLLDVLFPPTCVGCGVRGALLCAQCVAGIEPVAGHTCAKCQRPLPVSATPTPGAAAFPATPEQMAPSYGLCASCQARGDVPLVGLRVAGRYAGALRAAIWALKYHGQRQLAGPLGDLLVKAARPLADSLASPAGMAGVGQAQTE